MNKITRIAVAGILAFSVAIANPAVSVADSKVTVIQTISGVASWYGPGFHGKRTASGEKFNESDMTAAHPSLRFGTLVRVTLASTGRSVDVRINDRGPFHGKRIIDLSKAAAHKIGLIHAGTGTVKLEILS